MKPREEQSREFAAACHTLSAQTNLVVEYVDMVLEDEGGYLNEAQRSDIQRIRACCQSLLATAASGDVTPAAFDGTDADKKLETIEPDRDRRFLLFLVGLLGQMQAPAQALIDDSRLTLKETNGPLGDEQREAVRHINRLGRELSSALDELLNARLVDEVYRYNQARWEALVEANALFTRPWLDLDARSARERLDPWNLLGDLAGRRVLCLAGGGGQQSAAFALLGAAVTVLDISAGQLDKDRQAAAHYGLHVVTRQGDMRDLSAFAGAAFDIVWHPYAISFVPDCRVVFKEVARVLRPGGLYHFMVANPFACGMGTRDWNGDGYVVRRPYVEGAEITYQDEEWVVPGRPEAGQPVAGPREYRHTLSRILNGLVGDNFVVLKVSEWAGHQPNPAAPPGEWEHFTAYLPPWLSFWALYRPDLSLSYPPTE